MFSSEKKYVLKKLRFIFLIALYSIRLCLDLSAHLFIPIKACAVGIYFISSKHARPYHSTKAYSVSAANMQFPFFFLSRLMRKHVFEAYVNSEWQGRSLMDTFSDGTLTKSLNIEECKALIRLCRSVD